MNILTFNKANTVHNQSNNLSIVKGELYMWGKAKSGCMGRSDVKEVVK